MREGAGLSTLGAGAAAAREGGALGGLSSALGVAEVAAGVAGATLGVAVMLGSAAVDVGSAVVSGAKPGALALADTGATSARGASRVSQNTPTASASSAAAPPSASGKNSERLPIFSCCAQLMSVADTSGAVMLGSGAAEPAGTAEVAGTADGGGGADDIPARDITRETRSCNMRELAGANSTKAADSSPMLA